MSSTARAESQLYSNLRAPPLPPNLKPVTIAIPPEEPAIPGTISTKRANRQSSTIAPYAPPKLAEYLKVINHILTRLRKRKKPHTVFEKLAKSEDDQENLPLDMDATTELVMQLRHVLINY